MVVRAIPLPHSVPLPDPLDVHGSSVGHQFWPESKRPTGHPKPRTEDPQSQAAQRHFRLSRTGPLERGSQGRTGAFQLRRTGRLPLGKRWLPVGEFELWLYVGVKETSTPPALWSACRQFTKRPSRLCGRQHVQAPYPLLMASRPEPASRKRPGQWSLAPEAQQRNAVSPGRKQ